MTKTTTTTALALLLVFCIMIPFVPMVNAADALSWKTTPAGLDGDTLLDDGIYIIAPSDRSGCVAYSTEFRIINGTRGWPVLGKIPNLGWLFYISQNDSGAYTLSSLTTANYCFQAEEDHVTLAPTEDSVEQLWYIAKSENGYVIESASKRGWFMQYTDKHSVLKSALLLGDETEATTWELLPADVQLSDLNIYVKAPAGWAPMLSPSDLSEVDLRWKGTAAMTPSDDGWYAFSHPLSGKIQIGNQNYDYGDPPYPDVYMYGISVRTDSDVWIVIHDDPNITGDITCEVSYTNPDESSPKTSDDIDGSFALLLMCVSTAAICAMIFIYRPRCIQH